MEGLVTIAEEEFTLLSEPKWKRLLDHCGFSSADSNATRLIQELVLDEAAHALATAMIDADNKKTCVISQDNLEPVRKRHRVYLWKPQ